MKEMICIACPLGCHLEVEILSENNLNISGNKCSRGKEYAKQEFFDPKRIVTTTCRTNSLENPRIPVKTDKVFSKDGVDNLLEFLHNQSFRLPIKVGDILIENFDDTGINIVATKSILAN